MHAAVFDYGNDSIKRAPKIFFNFIYLYFEICEDIYIGVASQTIPFPPSDPNDVIPAYNRQFIQLSMDDLFSLENN